MSSNGHEKVPKFYDNILVELERLANKNTKKMPYHDNHTISFYHSFWNFGILLSYSNYPNRFGQF
jgi:hypothetical protein